MQIHVSHSPTVSESLGMGPRELSNWFLCTLKFENNYFKKVNCFNSKAVKTMCFKLWFPSSALTPKVPHTTAYFHDSLMSAAHHFCPWPRDIQHSSTPVIDAISLFMLLWVFSILPLAGSQISMHVHNFLPHHNITSLLYKQIWILQKKKKSFHSYIQVVRPISESHHNS